MTVTGVGVTAPNTTTSAPLTNSTFSETAVPFLGWSVINLPGDVVSKLLCHFPEAKLDDWVGLYAVDCAQQQTSGSLDVTFANGAMGSVPFAELVIKLPKPDCAGCDNSTVDFDTTCWLGVLASPAPIQLGAPFMRSHTGEPFQTKPHSAATIPRLTHFTPPPLAVLFRQDEEMLYLASAANCGEDIVSTNGTDPGMLFGDCGVPPPGLAPPPA
jgi:hypothetical protein